MNPKKCLVIKCENEAHTRGLCYRCYAVARTMLEKGETTEEVLVRKGMMTPKKVKYNLFKEQFNS